MVMQGYVELIREGVPDLGITSVREIVGGGQFSIVLVINEALIFRFPRSDAVAISMAREVAILKTIQGWVSLPIPNPVYSVVDRQGRQVLMGYPMLVGEPMSSRTLAGADGAVVDRVMDRFLDYYPEMRATLPRVRFIRSTYALQQALHALRLEDQADFEDGMQDYV